MLPDDRAGFPDVRSCVMDVRCTARIISSTARMPFAAVQMPEDTMRNGALHENYICRSTPCVRNAGGTDG